MWIGLLTAVALCIYWVWHWNRSNEQVDAIHRKCVFITGCDSGFGNALARRLDVLGVPVFAGCFTEKGATELRGNSSSILQTVMVDVTSHDSITKAFEFVKTNLPSGTVLWGIVNNAGIAGNLGPLEYMTREKFTDVYDVNLLGPIDVTQTFLPLLKESEGRVVFISSNFALVHWVGTYPYSLSKVAVRAFAGALRQEKKAYGIKVSCLLPGGFKNRINDPDIFQRVMDKQWKELPQDIKEEFGEEYHSQLTEGWKFGMKQTCPDLTPVVDAYEHALLAKRPRDEYYPHSIYMAYVSLLPSFLSHRILFGSTMLLPRYLVDKVKSRR